MLIPVKKGNVLLSNWILINYRDWIKHRVRDYSNPMDCIRLSPTYNFTTGERGWHLTFEGPNMDYIAYAYKQAYSYSDGGFISDNDLQAVKDRIDKFLTKIDKLVAFT